MEDKILKIQNRIAPDYYEKFHCLGGDCRLTCCGGWRINFSKKDYTAIKGIRQPKELRDKIEHSMKRIRGKSASDKNYAEINLNREERCPLLTSERLCGLQLDAGFGYLPQVCQVFPRQRQATPAGLLELSCGLGCEEVLNLLFAHKEEIDFFIDPLPVEEQREMVLLRDDILGRWFGPIRDFCISVLQNRTIRLSHRLLLLGFLLRDLNERAKEAGDKDMSVWLNQKMALAKDPEVLDSISQLPGHKGLFVINNIKLLSAMPTSSKEMTQLKEQILKMLVGAVPVADGNESGSATVNLDAYSKAEEEFLEHFGDLEYFFENIMVNTFFHFKFPLVDKRVDIWANYVNFCNIYSYFRFMAVCGAHGSRNPGDLIHALTIAARNLLNDRNNQLRMVSGYFENDSSSLGHMAVLVNG